MKKFNIVLICLAFALAPALTFAALTRQLELGSQGTDVSDLQRFLATDSSVYPSGLVTGYFGSLTKAAVTRFQAKNGISQVGRVGPQTMSVINSQMGGTTLGSAPMFTTPVGVTLNGNTATFNVNTNIPSRVSVFYSTSPITGTENVFVTPMTVTLSGTGVMTGTSLLTANNVVSLPLESNRTYYFRAVATSANGEVSVTYPATFQSNY
ncbi:MAG: peptidoglycan-binding domain-containing protein [Patescibacteria group bacterium]